MVNGVAKRIKREVALQMAQQQTFSNTEAILKLISRIKFSCQRIRCYMIRYLTKNNSQKSFV
jgi:hypothetical protein